MMNKVCLECGRLRDSNKDYWNYKNIKVCVCKDCMVSHMDYSNIKTVFPYMKKFDVPYIPSYWDMYVKQINKRGKKGVFGAYLACMKLASFCDFGYEDSKILNNKKEK